MLPSWTHQINSYTSEVRPPRSWSPTKPPPPPPTPMSPGVAVRSPPSCSNSYFGECTPSKEQAGWQRNGNAESTPHGAEADDRGRNSAATDGSHSNAARSRATRVRRAGRVEDRLSGLASEWIKRRNMSPRDPQSVQRDRDEAAELAQCTFVPRSFTASYVRKSPRNNRLQ